MIIETPPSAAPSPDARRAAVVRAMAQAPGLVRFAARYTRSIHDAEDAYQRAMEIALREAPVVDEPEFVAWLHSVIKNEAHSIVRRQRQESPGDADDLVTDLTERSGAAPSADAMAEWRERYQGLRAALNVLTESQRVCLMLRSAGSSYGEIAVVTGYSSRKVERAVSEGRATLHGWELKAARGEDCARILPALTRLVDNEATSREERSVERHTKKCRTCRSLLTSRRKAAMELASFVPPALIAGVVLPTRPPDASQAIAWWDRIAGGATVRAGSAWQSALELPGMLGTKVGAGAAAAVVAGVAGGPFVADAVRGDPPPARATAAIVRPATLPPAAPPAPVVRRATPPAAPVKPRARAPVRARTEPSRRAVVAPPAPAPRRTSPPPAPPRAASLEFGP